MLVYTHEENINLELRASRGQAICRKDISASPNRTDGKNRHTLDRANILGQCIDWPTKLRIATGVLRAR
jgi:hypothetical protein